MIEVEPVYPPVKEVEVGEQVTVTTTTPTVEFAIGEPIDVEYVPPVEPELPYELSEYERRLVECMVMGEIGGESYEGQMLVAQCILNAVLKDGIPPSQVRIDYQYSGWNDYPTDSVKKAVSEVFDLGKTIVDEPILYFYAPKLVYSHWHETQVFVIEEGNTRFFKEWD